MKKTFGLEKTELLLRLLQSSFNSLAASQIVKKSSFAELKSKNNIAVLSPWTILRYERISSGDDLDPLIVSALSTHPLRLKSQLEFLKLNCKVVSLSQLAASIKEGREISLDTVVLTFDGGFRDSFRNALPILKELQLPATFFIPTGLINTNALAWRDQAATAVAYYVRQYNNFPILRSIDPDVAVELQNIYSRNGNELILARGVVAAIELVPPNFRVHCLEELASLISNIRFQDPDRVYMTWEEVKACYREGIEIGSLGTGATSLLELSKEELAEDLHLSYQSLFENQIDPSRVFALPRGEIKKEFETFLPEMGFPVVVGENYYTPSITKEGLRILKRISINDSNSKTLNTFICRATDTKKPFSKEAY